MNGSCNLVRKIGEFQLCETTPVQLLGISWQSEHVCFLMLLDASCVQTLSSKGRCGDVWSSWWARIWGYNGRRNSGGQ